MEEGRREKGVWITNFQLRITNCLIGDCLRVLREDCLSIAKWERGGAIVNYELLISKDKCAAKLCSSAGRLFVILVSWEKEEVRRRFQLRFLQSDNQNHGNSINNTQFTIQKCWVL